MSSLSLKFKKWTVRSLVAVSTLLGLSSCHKTVFDPKTVGGVYGPPPGYYDNLEQTKIPATNYDLKKEEPTIQQENILQ
jgi:hypothetical protein